MKKQFFYSFAADVIRTVAIAGVLVIHIGSSIHARADFLGGGSWWLINLLNSISRSAIPLFILLSGYLLLDKQETALKTLKRLFWRILFPLVSWFIFYTWWSAGNPSMANLSHHLWGDFLHVNVFHLYFLMIMLGLYAILPFLRTFLHTLSPKAQQIAAIGTILIGILSIAIQYIVRNCTTSAFTIWIPFTGFFIAGYVSKKVQLNRIWRYILLSMFLFFLIFTASLNYVHLSLLKAGNFLLHPAGCLSGYFDHYLSPNVVVMSIAIFILLLNTNYRIILKTKILTTLIQTIARAAFGMYLVHIAVINFIDVQLHLALDFTSVPLLVYFLAKYLAVFSISLGITLVGRQIPGVKKLFGE